MTRSRNPPAASHVEAEASLIASDGSEGHYCRHSGRAAGRNEQSRFSPTQSVLECAGPSPVTECRPVRARSIISRNSSPDIPFFASINPYQGCEHGCIYCYARPTHAYHDLSPGLDFETRLQYKVNAAEQLQRELGRPGYRCQAITLGANTDPYQAVEANHRISRQLLEVLWEHRHPVAIITKSSLITRDIDILAPMAAKGLCTVAISMTTLDTELKRRLEPRAATAGGRLAAMRTLSEAGIPVSVLCAPVIPALTDMDLEDMLTLSRDHGATTAAYILIRLPGEVRALFHDWLRANYPDRAERVISLIRQSRGGQDNDSRFGHRMRGQGAYAEVLRQRFRLSCKKLGFTMSDSRASRCDLFRVPARPGQQLGLFDSTAGGQSILSTG